MLAYPPLQPVLATLVLILEGHAPGIDNWYQSDTLKFQVHLRRFALPLPLSSLSLASALCTVSVYLPQ